MTVRRAAVAACLLGAALCLALQAAWLLGKMLPLGLAIAVEVGSLAAWAPAVLAFGRRAKARFGSPFAPELVRRFFPTFFEGTPPALRRAAVLAVAYAGAVLLARWLWQLPDPASLGPEPLDPELAAVAFAFYVLSAAALAGEERPPGPRPL